MATGTVGAGWATAVAALFVIIGARRADQSLLLTGFRPTELVSGRILTVLGLAAVVTPLFAVVIWSQRDIGLGTLVTAIALAQLVAVAIGVVAAALVPREMEGVLVIIGIVGIQMSGDAQNWMPLWGTSQMIQRASGVPDAAATESAVAHSVIFAVVLLALGVALWGRRTRLHSPMKVLPMAEVVPGGRTSPARRPA